MVHTCPYKYLAVLDLAAAVCVGPGLPIYNFELEVLVGLTRNRGSITACLALRIEALLTFLTSHFALGITLAKPGSQVPGMLRERKFLARPGFGIVISRFTFWNGPKLVADAWMEIPTNLDERELCWAPKECHGVRAPVVKVMSVFVQGRGHFLLGGLCPIWKALSTISPDAKLAGGGQILLCRPSALALWNAL
eukprot:1139439-Pelagomonas_calceolata.AAC.1